MEYIGDEMPRWVGEGVQVRVKHTPVTRKHGLGVKAWANDRTWNGEVGVIKRVEGNGWWNWQVEFPRALSYSLSTQLLENLVRVK